MKKQLFAVLVGLSVFAGSSVAAWAATPAADKTTKYRVYQNEQILKEFSDLKQATDYARGLTNSHVEQIGTRQWLWDNLPRYKVYQRGYSTADWEFATLEQAIAEARKWSNASVRDMQGAGWVWNNYPKYRLYQNDATMDSWTFATLAEATAEGRKWANSHVIELSTNRWVWDNIPEAKKQEYRSGAPAYQVYQGSYTRDEWQFAYLEDAVAETLKWSNSRIVRLPGKQTVFENAAAYQVHQNGNLLESFVGLDDAIDYANRWAHAKIVHGRDELWNNYPFYRVYQKVSGQDHEIGETTTLAGALAFAMQYANSSVRTYHGKMLWDNVRLLQFWAWNGSSASETIRTQVAPTQGLDVDSPTWFTLADSDGNLTDNSKQEMVAELKKQGIAVHPLVSNQFDSALTTRFLSNPAAQQKFIDALVNRSAQLGVDGINIDFESLSGKDRDKYTAFVRNFTEAAHAKGLTVSIDLPRGSVSWNHLSAFDHEKLAGIVDYIITMTYDQHYSGSPTPGSVAGLQWVEQGIREFLSYGIPRDKLIVGVPFYVRAWRLDASGGLVDNRAVLMKAIPALIKDKNAKLTWDSRFNQYKAEYLEDGYTHVFWIEDETTMKARLELAKKYDVAGIAAWRLGYEPPELWDMMIRQK